MTNEECGDRPFVLGVTGNIACGKSLVTRELRELGAATIDADRVYHRLIEPGLPLFRALVDRFGNGIVGTDGRIDRQALGRVVFANADALADLDRITHPPVIAEIDRLVSSSAAAAVAVDAVKLIESGMDAGCDQVWLVTCRPNQQVDRLMRRNRLSRAEAERRVAAQPPIGPKLARADLVIDNSGSIAYTHAQVRRSWNALPLPAGQPGH